MLKIFLAEDEYVVREGIKNNINWAEEGFSFVGEAGDGETALPMIMDLKPDILITDIKMPFMDGFELSRLAVKKLPGIKILILTGYGEFEYAREAIKIGAADYILKPVSSSQLLSAIKQVAERIEREREEKQLLLYYEQEMRENQKLERFKFFDLLLQGGNASAAELLEKAERLGLDLIAHCYCVLSFHISFKEDFSSDLLAICALSQKAEEAFKEVNEVCFFEKSADWWIFIIKAQSEQMLRKYAEDCIEKLKRIMESGCYEYFGGFGNPVFRLCDIWKSYRDSGKACARRHFPGANKFVFYENIECEDFDVKCALPFERSYVMNFLNNGIEDEVEPFVENYFNPEVFEGLKSVLFRQYVLTEVYLCTFGFLQKCGMEKLFADEGISLGEASKHIYSLEDAVCEIKKLLLAGIKGREKSEKGKCSDIVKKAKEYIENHFDEDISLNLAAASVNLSPSYFSALFSQEAGCTFIEYLTDVRMQKAAQLLSDTDMKIVDIGFEIGYRDSHYFASIFKKTFGCTPKEYRVGKRRE
ncbi:MAG TPA: response regulator [Oscillospiraceae bacterium]|nr:response regulator [Oscillospiraceae bacterium]